ncbi:MAG: STAS domain-containing protein [Marmoricola sp.]
MLTFDAVVRDDSFDQPTLVVTGDLDLMTVPVFVSAATDVLGQAEVTCLRLDLSGVGFMDSTGVNAVITLDHEARSSGRRLELVACSPYVERVLRLVGLGTLLG